MASIFYVSIDRAGRNERNAVHESPEAIYLIRYSYPGQPTRKIDNMLQMEKGENERKMLEK